VHNRVRDEIQFAYLAMQILRKNSDSWYEKYMQATHDQLSYMFLYISQDTSNFIRFRNNILQQVIINM